MTQTLADVELFEQTPWQERDLPTSVYHLIQRSAQEFPDELAMRFFLRGSDYHIEYQYGYQQMLDNIHQAANMFHGLGVGKDDVVSCILPNLPHSWFTLIGGQTAGIINPISPQLDASVMAEIMKRTRTKVLVTLAPFAGSELWDTIAEIAGDIPTLETILQINPSNFLGFVSRSFGKFMSWRMPRRSVPQDVYDFDKKAQTYPTDTLLTEREISPEDVAAYFPVGETIDTLKLVAHTHANEVVNAYGIAERLNVAQGDAFYCGESFYRVDGMILSGMVPLSKGGTMVFGPPNGFRGARCARAILGDYSLSRNPVLQCAGVCFGGIGGCEDS